MREEFVLKFYKFAFGISGSSRRTSADRLIADVFSKSMRIAVLILLISSFILHPSSLLHAAGGRPGGIFEFGAGARSLGMGGAHSAVARDATAVYYNPAGLSFMSNRNISLMHAMLFEGASYDYLGYAQNYGKLPGAWGAQVMRLGIGGAEGRDENNQPSDGFSYSETALAFGTGIRGVFLPFLSAGASVKMVSRALASSSDKLMAFDIGFQYGPLYNGRLNLALVAENFGGLSTGDTEDKLPLSYTLGAAYAVTPGVLVCADILGTGELRFGAEYLIGPGAVRLGYDKSAFSFGAGLKFLKSYQLDFAMLKHQELGLSNRISLGYFFGARTTAPPMIIARAGDYLEKAETALRRKDYLGALELINFAAGMDPEVKKGPWGEKGSRLERAVQGLNLRAVPERQNQLKAASEQAEEANRAIYEYIAGNSLKSTLLAHSAAGYGPNNAFYSEALHVLTALNSREVAKEEILPRAMLINLKLEKAAAAFYVQNFERVVKECSEVLALDEGNAEAWKKLGSAYFALGDTAGSKRAYGKVLELNANDESVLKFMTLQGWK